MTEAFGAVVLAAGGSTRLGRAKQLVVHEGRALVARAAHAALAVGAAPVIVVLGASADTVRDALGDLPVIPVVNARWQDGMGTSVATGVRAAIERAADVRGMLLVLADQPLVDAAALGRLVSAWRETRARAADGADDAIAAAGYADTLGVPAMFGRAHFDALRALPAVAGAASLLRAAGARVHVVPMREAAMDVDTPHDLARLVAHDDGPSSSQHREPPGT